MKHITMNGFGGPEVLQITTGKIPVPGPDQVLIKVAAAGVNRPDVLQRLGNYPPPPGASLIPGLEIAGEVMETYDKVNATLAGKQVCALVTGGGYAEYALADAALCLPVPRGLSAVEAAAIPETFFTVWSNVFDRGRLQPGESLLVHGGSSGIGTTAIQLGSSFGATVYTTAGSDQKCAACRELGAVLAVNYREQDFVRECLQATGNRGVDVILDMVAGEYINRNITLAAEDGRIVFIAGLAGFSAMVNFAPVMLKRLQLTGSTLRPRNVAFKANIAGNLLQHVWPLLESGSIRPVIHTTLPLSQAAAAHQIMEAKQHIGKIVLIP
jgi:putative PIG3 family NAD(P)H quinone oxidoreductase